MKRPAGWAHSVIVPPAWRLAERDCTPAMDYWNRRDFVRSLGAGVAAGVAGISAGACGSSVESLPVPEGDPMDCNSSPPAHPLQTICPSPTAALYPAPRRNNAYRFSEDITDRLAAATHNNYYEFIGRPDQINEIWDLMGPFQVWPWTVEVTGEVENPGVWPVEDLEREFGLEERVYRLRCVERWSAVIP